MMKNKYSLNQILDYISCPMAFALGKKPNTVSLDIRKVYNILAKKASIALFLKHFAMDINYKSSKELKSFEEIWFQYVAKINNLDFSNDKPIKPLEHIGNSIKIRSFLNYLFNLLNQDYYELIGTNIEWFYKDFYSSFDILVLNKKNQSIEIFQIEDEEETIPLNSLRIVTERSIGIYSLAKELKILPTKIKINYLYPLTKGYRTVEYRTDLRKFVLHHIINVIHCIQNNIDYPNQTNCIKCIYRDSCDWSLVSSKRGRNYIQVSSDLVKEF